MVAIGASAGGLDAFQTFFSRMPADSGMAFVLVQHLHPRHETLMPELISRQTPMPVQLVTDRTVAEPNCVYVIPPNATLTIDGCTLHVSRPSGGRGRQTPIDSFFRSLAEDQGDDAVGIILSGAGADGALGLKAIKEHGGMTMVQSPEAALYDSMPRSAILTGAADHVLPVEEMPDRLMEYLSQLKDARGGQAEGFREEIDSHLNKIAAILRRKTGHDFSLYKRSTLVRRIRRRMHVLRADSVSSYLERLHQDAKEADQLFHDLLIGVTHFFRDAEAFEILTGKVMPRLFDSKGADCHVRVWVPGCATGEEAYSIAILMREQMERLDVVPQVQVFATDIDEQALEAARQAWYPEGISSQVSAERLERFFVRHGNMYRVAREIREMCLFSTHNLIADPPFSRLDLLSCRNLLIYLESDLQKKLVPLCHYALRSGGYLFLGPSESVASHPELFRTLDKKHRIFQRKDTVLRPPVSFPLTDRTRYGARPSDGAARRPGTRDPELSTVFERVLLDHYAPPCVIVNERSEAVYFSPRVGRYLEPPAGAPSLNVVEMARKGLGLDLRTALHKAFTARVPVVHEEVTLEADGPPQRIHLAVRPLSELGEDSGLFMVVFQELGPAHGARPEEARPPGAAPGSEVGLVERLEAELRTAKDHLQATLEELESSNEELVSSNEELLSINEELQSANEEMQTSKEELQSVNEELETVNAELKKKIEALDRANSDLQNLFRSTRIATIFVDRELCIQRFTPAATDVFRLIDSDIGRPITDITPRFTGGDLVFEIQGVLRTLAPCERQVRLEANEACCILRILPYRTLDDVIDGVVITFVDVTDLKRAQEQTAQLAAIVESSQDAILGKTLDGVITSWNAGAERMYGYTAEEAVGSPIDLLVPPERREELRPIFESLHQGRRIETLETVRVTKDGRRLHVLLTISPVHGDEGKVVGASAIARDITDRKEAEDALKEAARRKDEFLALLGHELRNPLAPVRNCLHVLAQPNATSAQAEKARQTIERQVLHLTRLVDDLLDVARISQGRILLRRTPLDLVDLVRRELDDRRGDLAAAGLTLEVDLPDHPLGIDGDSTRLAQAVGNVLHNAGKFTEAGGNIHVTVREEPGQRAAVVIEDTGIGMGPEVLARLFEPFGHPPGDHGRGGLGLGLALVKSLIELHGGTVEAASAGQDQGSAITLRIPLAAAVAEAAPAEDAAEKGGLTRRCLLIEDHRDAAESLRVLLELAGHQVEVAFEGAEGIETARRFLPEVVLCDIGLPGMDGYAVARALRADPDLGSVRLIALTGYGQAEDQRRAQEAGFDTHLTKPADPDTLRRLLAG